MSALKDSLTDHSHGSTYFAYGVRFQSTFPGQRTTLKGDLIVEICYKRVTSQGVGFCSWHSSYQTTSQPALWAPQATIATPLSNTHHSEPLKTPRVSIQPQQPNDTGLYGGYRNLVTSKAPWIGPLWVCRGLADISTLLALTQCFILYLVFTIDHLGQSKTAHCLYSGIQGL